MSIKTLFLVFLLCFILLGCKKKFCIYGRIDLRASYILANSSKPRLEYFFIYNSSDPKNIFWTNKKELDSLINLEGYFIDTTIDQSNYGYRYRVEGDGNCQYCDYNKTFYHNNYCELHEQ